MLSTIQKAVDNAALAASDGKIDSLLVQAAPVNKADLAISVSALLKGTNLSMTNATDAVMHGLQSLPIFSSVSATGPYVNVRIDNDVLFRTALSGAAIRCEQTAHPHRIMVEYLSPNTNKPLHLGHVRNGVLGSTLSNLLEAIGHTVIRANLINDRGEHICKSMMAYTMFHKGDTPESLGMKGDHFVGDCYVQYANAEKTDESLKTKVAEMLTLWESGDSQTRRLWAIMNDWVYQGFDVTLQRYGFPFDKVYRESELYTLGKDKVKEGLEKDIFVRDEHGAVRFPLPENLGLGAEGEQRRPKVLNANGTSVYLTQDIGTAIVKADEFNLDRSINVVADEQNYHFMVLYTILGALGYPWAANCYHMSYAMVELPDGKMKSRTGRVVDADELADEMATMAASIIKERENDLTEAEIAKRSEVIGLAAIKFYLLRYGATKTIKFDPEASISFFGDTGPYCLYAYARARSVLEKASELDISGGIGTEEHTQLGTEHERALALQLILFPQSVRKAADNYAPSLLVEAMLNIAKCFNRFYKKDHILTENVQLSRERLLLVRATAEALQWGFSLLNIEPLEKM